MAKITKGWYFNSDAGKYRFGVYNSSGDIKDVFDEDGNLFQTGTQLTASSDELNGADVSAVGAGQVFVSESLPIVAAATAQDTEIVVPNGAVIKNVWVVVETEETTGATKTVDIGISGGDENGFLDGVSVAATGTIQGTLDSGGQTLGVLLSADEDGAGALVPEPYVCSAATTICYTLGSDDFAELVAKVVVEYVTIA